MGNRALNSGSVSSSRRLRWGVVPPGFLYSPFTAADEKIPLSIGQVNSKPQYLVFSSHLLDELTKHSDSRCGKRKFPTPERLFSLRIARNSVQIAIHCRSGTQTSLCSSEDTPQGMETVQIRLEIVRIVDISWAHPEEQGPPKGLTAIAKQVVRSKPSSALAKWTKRGSEARCKPDPQRNRLILSTA